MEDVVKDVPVTEEPVGGEPIVEPGSKTDPALLLKALQEEREEKKRERDARLLAEQKLLELTNIPETDIVSEEGKALQDKISSLEEKLAIKDIGEQFPAIKDKQSEFIEFRKLYPGFEIQKVAKLFLVEKDLFEKESRIGLEKSAGGVKTPPKQGLTESEIADIRKNDSRKYYKLLKEGKIQI